MNQANEQRTILVTGVTGQQGGAAARHLLSRGYRVRGLTRNPDSDKAKRMKQHGVELVAGDMGDRASLDAALAGAYGVFSVQNFWEARAEGEVHQGNTVADAAFASDIKHLVYSSVGSAHRATGIPHFDSKWVIEQHIRSLDLPATILRPVFFMDNWTMPAVRQMIDTGTLMMPLSPDTRLQQIAVDDIGAVAAMAFDDPTTWQGRDMDIAGDEPTMQESVEVLSRVLARKVQYQQIGWDDFAQAMGPEYEVMFRWFEDVGYEADIASLRDMHPGLKTLEGFLRETGWERTAA